MWIVRMTNDRGLTEWYKSLNVRAQAHRRDWAKQFGSKLEAQEAAAMCERLADAFSNAYYDGSTWTLSATVEEYCATDAY